MTSADDTQYSSDMLAYQTRMAENERRFNKNFDQLADELQGEGAGEAIRDRRMNDFVSSLLPPLRGPVKGDLYWRGVAAIFLATPEDMNTPTLKYQESFIGWAGQHDDVKTIIAFALERETYDVDTLRFLVEGSKGHNAIRKGAL